MNICHINLSRGYRGGERQTEYLVLACLSELAISSVSLVCLKGSPLALKMRSHAGLKLIEISSRLQGFALVRKQKPDLLHAHEAKAAHWTFTNYLIYKTPYIVTRRVQNKVSWITRNLVLNCASKVVAISSWIESYMRGCGLNVELVHSAVDIGTSQKAMISRFNTHEHTMLFAGSLDDAQKGISVLIDALSLIRGSWKAVIIGDGPDELALKNRVAELGLNELVSFLPWDDNELRKWFSEADVFVMPSFHEGLGSILLDAVLARIPIVATAVGGIPDIIENKKTGILVRAGSPTELVGALRLYECDDKLRESVVVEGARRVEKFSIPAMAGAYIDMYRSVLSNAS